MHQVQRAVFFGSSQFALPVLRALFKHQKNLDINLVSVVTQPDRPAGRGWKLTPTPVKVEACSLVLPILEPKKLKTSTEEGVAFVRAFRNLQPDVAILTEYGRLIPDDLLTVPRYGFLNLHPSLLPKFRGPSPIQTAILSDETVVGISLLLLESAMDAGPILGQRQVLLSKKTTFEELQQILVQEAVALLLETLPRYLRGELQPRPQDHSQATYTSLIKKDHGAIHWRESAEMIERKLRAYTPWPGCFTFWKTKRLKILNADIVKATSRLVPGTVFQTSSNKNKLSTICVQCGVGTLVLKLVQLEGKNPVPIHEFIKGSLDFIGSVLSERQER